MRSDTIIFLMYYCGCKVLHCSAILPKPVKEAPIIVGKDLNTLRENRKEFEELQHVKRRLNYGQDSGRSEKAEFTKEINKQKEFEEVIQPNEGNAKVAVGDKTVVKPLKEGVKKVAKAACHCVCLVSKTFSNLVRTCYGKLRALCCKDKLNDKSNIDKTLVSSTEESLDFGLY